MYGLNNLLYAQNGANHHHRSSTSSSSSNGESGVSLNVFHNFILNHGGSRSRTNSGSTDPDVSRTPDEYNGSSSTPSPYASTARVVKSNHSHHHHSIQELIRHFGKKVHHWRSSERRASCSEDNKNSVYCDNNNDGDEFRERSKSLDANFVHNRVLSDCESTYRIYDSILREG